MTSRESERWIYQHARDVYDEIQTAENPEEVIKIFKREGYPDIYIPSEEYIRLMMSGDSSKVEAQTADIVKRYNMY